MRAQIIPQKATKAVRESKSRLEQRIERLLLEMSNTVTSIGADQWRDQLALLLSHPKPPKGLEIFHQAMRAAIVRPRRDEQFVDRVLEAVAASERYRRLDNYLEPIQLALLSFVSSVSRRPSVMMSAVGRLIRHSGAKLPLQMSCWPLEPHVQPRQVEKKYARYAQVDVAGSVQRAVNVLLEERATGSGAFATWSYEDRLAGLKALWLAYSYCSVGTASSVCLKAEDLRSDFERCGAPLWKQLNALIAKSSRTSGEQAGLNTSADFARLTLSVGTARDEDLWVAEDDEEQVPEASLSGLTHSRHYDNFLKTECDFSKVSWICTANTLSAISKPMQSRLRIVLVPQPRREDLPRVCAGVISELEKRWGVPTGTIPSVAELAFDMTRLTSARQARAATEAVVSLWARSVVRH
jgi:hypothetical protein